MGIYKGFFRTMTRLGFRKPVMKGKGYGDFERADKRGDVKQGDTLRIGEATLRYRGIVKEVDPNLFPDKSILSYVVCAPLDLGSEGIVKKLHYLDTRNLPEWKKLNPPDEMLD
jgi:hypothetical protein